MFVFSKIYFFDYLYYLSHFYFYRYDLQMFLFSSTILLFLICLDTI